MEGVTCQVFPHHLWPPVEPWQGYCLQRSGPGRYSNQHLPAALMRWWGLRWATLRSDCWAAGVGWERANSAGRGANSQLARTWNQHNLEKLQNGHTPTTTQLMCVYCAHSNTHRSYYYSYSMSNFIYHLVNQPHKLHNMYTVWWFGFILILGPSQRLHCVMKATFALAGFMTAFLSASIPQWFWAAFTEGDHPIRVELTSIFWIYKLAYKLIFLFPLKKILCF